MSPRIGSLCSGYGGLDLAVERFFGGQTVWFSEFEAAPSKVLAHHWPTVPNLGDMTKVDWSNVPPIDIATGGTPCQDLSTAGRRRGMTDGTRSNLWVQMRECIAATKPSIVIWENVRGAYSACADSEVGQCPRCMGQPGKHRPFLRALGRVLGDLSDLGFDAEVVGLRASDAGAPHERFRVFVVAYAADADRATRDQWRLAASRQAEGGWTRPDACGSDRAWTGLNLLPTPTTMDSQSSGGSTPSNVTLTDAVVRTAMGTRQNPRHFLPTPIGSDAQRGTIHRRDGKRGERMSSIGMLLPTPSVADATGGHARRGGDRGDELLLPGIAASLDAGTWGEYAEAVARWESILGRPAPEPTLPDGKGGKRRLNARLVEWMMGQEDGWVTSPQIGLTRNEQLKALGNGVVTQQAELALTIAWDRILEAVVA